MEGSGAARDVEELQQKPIDPHTSNFQVAYRPIAYEVVGRVPRLGWLRRGVTSDGASQLEVI